MNDEHFIKIAIKEAKKGSYPFGALIVKDNKIIAKTHNTAALDPTAHAEVNAIRKACKKMKSVNLTGCTLYSSCEPCPMCFYAAWWANISKIVYSIDAEDIAEEEWKIDEKCYEMNKKSKSKIEIKGGILREEGLKLFKI